MSRPTPRMDHVAVPPEIRAATTRDELASAYRRWRATRPDGDVQWHVHAAIYNEWGGDVLASMLAIGLAVEQDDGAQSRTRRETR